MPRAKRPRPVTVRVSLTCSNARIGIKVQPWRARITKPGQGIVWRTGASVKEIRIRKHKTGDRWPFSPGPPNKRYKGNQAHPPRATGLKPGNKGKRFPYEITLAFTDPRGKLRHAVIDPDMVVDV